MLRRSFLARSAALAAVVPMSALLPACGGPTSTLTVQDVIDWLVANCNFNTNVASVVSVVLTFAANFDARLGPKAPIDGFVANLVEQAICNAVKAHQAQALAQRSEPNGRVVLTVNGVKIEGEMR